MTTLNPVGLFLTIGCLLGTPIAAAAQECEQSAAATETFYSDGAAVAFPQLVVAVEGSCATSRNFLLLGLIHRERGQLQDAARVFSRGLAMFADDYTLLLELAVTRSWQARIEEALNLYERALAVDPTAMPALLGVARTAGWSGQHDRARQIYSDLLTGNPDLVEAWLGMAWLAEVDLKYARARLRYTRVIELDPGNRQAIDALARLAGAGRTTFSLGVSQSGGVGRPSGTNAAATLNHRLTPVLALRGEYRGELHTLALTGLAENGGGAVWRSALNGRLSITPRGRFSFGVGSSLASRGEELAKGASLDGAMRIGGGAALMGGVRYSQQSGSTALLAWLGASASPISNHVLTLQLFHARGSGVTTLAGSLSWQATWPFGSTRLAASRGGSGAAAYRSLAAGISMNVQSRVALDVSIERFAGPYSAESANVGLTVRP